MHVLFVFDNQDRRDRNNTEIGQDKRALTEEYAKSKKGAKEKNRVENKQTRKTFQRDGANPPNFHRLSRVAPTPVTSSRNRVGNLERSTSTSQGCRAGSRVCTYDHR